MHAKFKCASVTRHDGGSETVNLVAVYGKGNESWSKFTPSGSLTMTITAEGAQGQITPGKEYMLEITDAPAAES